MGMKAPAKIGERMKQNKVAGAGHHLGTAGIALAG